MPITQAELVRALDDRSRACDTALETPMSGPLHISVEALPVLQALLHPEWTMATLEWAATVRAGCIGQGPPRACYICDKAWTQKHLPVLVIRAIVWKAPPVQIIAGACSRCASRADLPSRVAAQVPRDLGVDPATTRIIPDEGHA